MTDVKLAQNLTYLESGRAAKDYWRDLWRHRELLIFLVWRDIIVRYKQTVVGTSWVLIRPLLTMLVFTFVFGRVANLESGGVPYSLVVLSGLLPWTFFAENMGGVCRHSPWKERRACSIASRLGMSSEVERIWPSIS